MLKDRRRLEPYSGRAIYFTMTHPQWNEKPSRRAKEPPGGENGRVILAYSLGRGVGGDEGVELLLQLGLVLPQCLSLALVQNSGQIVLS
jgi:hypothetical protein